MLHRSSIPSLTVVTLLTLSASTALAQPAPPPGDPAPAPTATGQPPADPPPDSPSTPNDAPPGDSGPAAPAAATPKGPATPDGQPGADPGAIADPGGRLPATRPLPTTPVSIEGTTEEDLPRPIILRAGDFSAWPIALVQVQATPYIGANASFLSGDIAERAGFRIRRSRFGLGASYAKLLRAEIQAELLTNAQVTLLLNQAWVGVTPKPWFQAYMGMLDVPFSRSAMTPSADTILIDRSLASRALAPQQQLGAYVHGLVAGGKFQYTLGVYNGFQRFDQFYSGYRQPQAGFGNRFDNLAYAARIATALDTEGEDIPLPGDRKNRINLGASYFYSDGGARDVHAVEGDVLFQRAGFRGLAEFIYSSTVPESIPSQPTTQTANIDSYAAIVEAGYTFRKMVGGHVRFELIDPNTAVQDAADNWLLTVGVSFSPPVIGKYCRAQLEYTHREELFGAALENDSVTLQTQFMLQ
ncbi:MAG: porin [Polyangiaceae bacterium]